MIDYACIDKAVARLNEAGRRAQQAFGDATADQLNRRPGPGRWSAAECLEHLILSDSTYFGTLAAIADGSYRHTGWQRFSPLTGIWGALMKRQLKESVSFKMKTNPKLVPPPPTYGKEILERYKLNLAKFTGYVQGCKEVDLDRTILTSPLLAVVTYSLRDAVEFLAEHEHRHIRQGMMALKS